MLSLDREASSLGKENSQFRVLAERISAIAARYSLDLAPYDSPELPCFSALPLKKRSEVLRLLHVFLETMEAVESSGERLDNAERSVWHALVTMGLRPPSDLFSKIEPGDVVEIYDLENIQVWRNLQFLKICSYSIEQMYSVDWPSRYNRDPEKTNECISKVQAHLTGETPEVHFAGIGDHLLEETSSRKKLLLQARHDWFGRLKDQNGQFRAWMVTSKVRILSRDHWSSHFQTTTQQRFESPIELPR